MTAEVPKEQRIESALIALSIACAFGIFAFSGIMGLTRSVLAAVIVAAGIAVFVAWLFWRRSLLPFEDSATSRPLKIVSGLATIAALALYNRIYPEGYTLGKELGSDTGDIHRDRGFYIIDRTAEVGFKPGEDLNVEKMILLRRRIE